MIDPRIAAAALVAASLTGCSSHPAAAQSTGKPATASSLQGSEWFLERIGDTAVLEGAKPTLGLAGAMSLVGDRLTIKTSAPDDSLVFVRSK